MVVAFPDVETEVKPEVPWRDYPLAPVFAPSKETTPFLWDPSGLHDPWMVLLHNDDHNTFAYVAECIQKVVDTLTNQQAFAIVSEAHYKGVATVGAWGKEKAEGYCDAIVALGIVTTVEHD